MASLKDVAKLANVSVSTASKVLNTGSEIERLSDACIRRVRTAAKELSYRPNYHAQGMQRGTSMTVGLVIDVPHSRDLVGQPYFAKLIGGVQSACNEAGYSLSLISGHNGMSAFDTGFEHLGQRRIDGLVLLGSLSRTKAIELDRLTDFPVVIIQPQVPTRLPSVNIDTSAGISLAVRHLAELGHRRVMWLGPRDERQQAFAATAWEHGIQGELCILDGDREAASLIDAAGEQLLAHYEQHDPEVSAVVCWNDLIAVGVYEAMRHLGKRIPDDMSVVGFDDMHADLLSPPLTSVSHRLHAMGSSAGGLLFEIIGSGRPANEFAGRHVDVEATLSPRQSTIPYEGGVE